MDLGLAGRVAVVAASSKGLGLASARALVGEGCHVVLNGRDADSLAAAAASMPTGPAAGDVATLAGDMAEEGVPAALVDLAIERWGRLDIAVANNGGPPPIRALDVTDEQVTAAIEGNLLASVRLVRAAHPHMAAAGWGRICFITSASIKEPIPSLSLSNMARTGLWAWAKTAAKDLGEGVTLNLVCPGLHDTDRVKVLGLRTDAPIGNPADFGRVVAFLCSTSTGFINGTAVVVDGGAIAGLL